MKTKIAVIFIALILVMVGCAKPDEAREEAYNLEVAEGTIYGTLVLPEGNGPFKIAIIHQGSGPTDRDGNSAIAGSNNGLKMLADSLADAGIASIRYDKRGIAESMSLIKSESELVFENYIEDLELWMEKAREDGRFDEIYLIGHSEGALISAVAASRNDISGFVSLAGVGEPAYDTLIRQLSLQPKEITDLTTPIINELKEGRTVSDVPELLAALFRDSVQPYLISWFKYDPAKVYAEIKAPILIIQGDNDLQVTVEDAKKLGDASGIEPIIISEMNHILKQAPTDRDENLKTYANPVLPLHSQLMEQIINFINEN
jgi:hypothetical protein